MPILNWTISIVHNEAEPRRASVVSVLEELLRNSDSERISLNEVSDANG
jgi:hypothetical protein